MKHILMLVFYKKCDLKQTENNKSRDDSEENKTQIWGESLKFPQKCLKMSIALT